MSKKRTRRVDDGFIGVNLVKGGDKTLLERFNAEIEADPELDKSKLVRLALKEYFDRKDHDFTPPVVMSGKFK